MEEHKNENIDYNGMFDVDVDDIKVNDSEGYSGPSDPDLYAPSLKNKNVKDGVYAARLRFLTNPRNPKRSIIKKYIYFLEDPETNGVFMVDCPSNSGKRVKNIISEAFFTLKDSESKILRDIAYKFFSRKTYFWSLVEIYSDKQDPDYENKIKIFRYGKQVKEKIDIEMSDDKKVGRKAVNVFSPFAGKDFIMYIEEDVLEDRRKITSYEKSYFEGQITSMMIAGQRIEPKPENQRVVYEYLMSNSPELEKMEYVPWDNQLEQKVIESVRHSINDPVIFDKIYRSVYKSAPKPINKDVQATTTIPEAVKAQSREFDNAIEQKPEPTQVPEQPSSESWNFSGDMAKNDNVEPKNDDGFNFPGDIPAIEVDPSDLP